MKKKCMGILAAVVLLALSGCGTQEVSYDDMESAGNKQKEAGQEQGAGEEETAGGTLADELGVEEVWNDTVTTDTGEILAISAEVEVPDVSGMCTMEVSEYYYTPEDKKRVAEYFMDAGSIQVDMDTVPTKENLTKQIEQWEKAIEKAKEQEIEEKIASAIAEKKRLESLFNEAPAAADIEPEPGDYSQNYFKGQKGDIEYMLGFEIDEERNASSWTLNAKDYAKFNTVGAQYCVPQYTSQQNKCAASIEDIQNKAVKTCEELGLADMRVKRIDSVMWGEEKEVNGYWIILSRDIEGVAADVDSIFLNTEVDVESEKIPYEVESVTIGMNDSGIFQMIYSGILGEGKIGENVKLLAFEQMKEIFRTELAKAPMNIHYIELAYVRVEDETQNGKYSYIPVWKLLQTQVKHTGDSNGIWGAGYFNAIDGTRIDLVENGLYRYIGPDWILNDYEEE
ncbi:MAG: hypothetical protein K2J90_10035 [Lachnospiraceae bacterium]|nr:hypothetical protein [Lachnospiraceae bacterium]